MHRRGMSVGAWTGAIVILVGQTTLLAGSVLLAFVAAAEKVEPFLDSSRAAAFYLLVGAIVAVRALILARPEALAKWRAAGVQHHDPVRRWFRLAREASFLGWLGCMIIIFSGVFWPLSLLLVRRLRQTRRSRLAEADEREVEELSLAMRDEAGR